MTALVLQTVFDALIRVATAVPGPRVASTTDRNSTPAPRPIVSVVIPSYARPALLAQCLAGVEAQRPPADEVVVVHRPDDNETVEYLAIWTVLQPARRRAVQVLQPGLVHALIAGTREARGEVLCYLDDDAVPRAGWLAELLEGFWDESVAAVGGRYVDHVDGRVVTGRTRRVGVITWYGRVIGRHHLDTDYCGDVDLLAGANMAYRRHMALHDPALLHASTGLALGNELDACLTLRRRGHRVLYRPRAVVDHYTTSFRDASLGSRVAGRDVYTAAANYTYILLKYLPAHRRVGYRFYAYVVGSASQPGPLRALLELPRSPRRARAMAARVATTWAGRLRGERMWQQWRVEEAAGGTPALRGGRR